MHHAKRKDKEQADEATKLAKEVAMAKKEEAKGSKQALLAEKNVAKAKAAAEKETARFQRDYLHGPIWRCTGGQHLFWCDRDDIRKGSGRSLQTLSRHHRKQNL